MPKVSAIMALYNTPYEYLDKTMKSILAQSFEDFELIVVDDASSIDYKEYFEKFNDKRIKYRKLAKNSGPGVARNSGMLMAQGEYLAICDSDDVYVKDRFKLQVEYLDSHQDVSVLGGAYRFSNKTGVANVITSDDELKIFLLFNSPFANPIMMLRRKFFIDNNLFYSEMLNFGEDYALWVNAMCKKAKTANMKDVLMVYTRRKGQLSKQNNQKQEEALKVVYKNILTKIGMKFSDKDVDMQLQIYQQKFKDMKREDLSFWFYRLIEANKKSMILPENELLKYRDYVLDRHEKINNRIFKMKIGNKNFCIQKPFKFVIENR
ncbi:MAG: glycosyltransferase [bacterium]|nr:glycosyltransferase [bacterium]